MTAALVTFGCSIGVNLTPMMLAADKAAPLLTSESLKLAATQYKWSPEQVRQIQTDIDAVNVAQKKLVDAQSKMSSTHIKRSAEQEKIKAIQTELEAAKAKLAANQSKLTAVQDKIRAVQDKHAPVKSAPR